MSIQEAYDNWAATYDSDRNLTRDLDGVVTRSSLAGFRCRTILEIGCGTGKNTEFLAKIGEMVHAVDFSRAMLDIARAKLPCDHVQFSVADVTRRWPCYDQVFDLAVCDLVLEHIEDLSFVFSEAFRCLVAGGHFFICELHPFRQYQGTKAVFSRQPERIEIPAYVHHISDFLGTAGKSGFVLEELKEWWHEEDRDKPPRLLSLMFQK